METSSLKKTAMVAAIAGTFATAIPQADANVANFSWTGAFTFLGPSGNPVPNVESDYMYGHYADGSGNYPANTLSGSPTTHGWFGNRTPVSGTLSFDTSTGAGVGTINPWMFFGDTPGSGPNTSVGSYPQGVTFQTIDTVGTMVGSLLFSWNGLGHSVSIVLDGSGLLNNLSALIAGGSTTSLSGVGVLSATENTNFGNITTPIFLPLGPSPIATKTLNTGAGCDAITLATQVNAYTINTNFANVGTCTTGMSDDGIGGDPMTSSATSGFHQNYDITSIHFESFVPTPSAVPVPAAVWLFGSGLLGLFGFAQRKKKTG